MALTQDNRERYIEIPEPVRARHYDVNIAADDALHVLEANYEIIPQASAPNEQIIPASQEVRDYTEAARDAKVTNPLFNQSVAPSPEVATHAARVEADQSAPVSPLSQVDPHVTQGKIDEMLDQEQRVAALRAEIDSLKYESHNDIPKIS